MEQRAQLVVLTRLNRTVFELALAALEAPNPTSPTNPHLTLTLTLTLTLILTLTLGAPGLARRASLLPWRRRLQVRFRVRVRV